MVNGMLLLKIKKPAQAEYRSRVSFIRVCKVKNEINRIKIWKKKSLITDLQKRRNKW